MASTHEPPESAEPHSMSFGAHLDELRRRVVLGLVGIAPVFVLSMVFGGTLLEIILRPAQDALRASNLPPLLIATSPLETLTAWMKVGLVFTLVVGVPWLVYQVWRFVAPGLYEHEKRFARLLVPLSATLSLLGLLFLYFVMLPAMLTFLVGFGADVGRRTAVAIELPPGVVLPTVPVLPGDPADPPVGSMWINKPLEELRINATGASVEGRPAPVPDIRGTPLHKTAGITPQLKVSEYVGLVFTMAIAFAVGFQTPVVVLLLGWIGIVDPVVLQRSRRYALLAAFVVAALLTPSPDPFSMVLLALPLYVLYEFGLVLVRYATPDRVARGLGRGAREADGEAE